ncbi:MAG: MarR family transcriptional regulator [Novosphingobium sp.]|nr:MarR family transcriptional regulator [Novosphingobium sp.]
MVVSDAASLSTLQKLVIFAVFDAPAPLTVPQIGRVLGHPRQVIQRAVNDLVRNGLLEKVPNPHHKRAMLLVPTDKISDIKQRAEKRALETAEAFMETISAERCHVLAGELSVLREAIEAFIQERYPSDRNSSDATQPISSTWSLLDKLK